jgi:hypothetical protein
MTGFRVNGGEFLVQFTGQAGEQVIGGVDEFDPPD